LTGPLAPNSVAFIEGQSLFFDKLNASGGINGRALKVITYDDAYSAERASENAERLLVRDRVACLFGAMGTAVGAAAATVAAKHGSFVFGGLTGAQILRDPQLPIYHVRASYADEASRAIAHLHTLGLSRIALIVSDDAYGRGIERDALRILAATGQPPATSLSFDPRQADQQQVAELVSKSGAQAVYVVAAGVPAVNVIRALTLSPSHPQIYTNSVASSFLLYKELGDRSRGIVLTQVMPPFWQSRLGVVHEYRQALESAGQLARASYLGLEGYVTAKTFAELARRVSGPVNAESLRKAIENSGSVDVGGLNIVFKPGHRGGSDYVDITLLGSGGKFVR
jgi:ABC-type branched-subunit amino acid transport system substrate-binding protein